MSESRRIISRLLGEASSKYYAIKIRSLRIHKNALEAHVLFSELDYNVDNVARELSGRSQSHRCEAGRKKIFELRTPHFHLLERSRGATPRELAKNARGRAEQNHVINSSFSLSTLVIHSSAIQQRRSVRPRYSHSAVCEK